MFSFTFYQLAMREACKYVEEKLAVKVRKCCLLRKFQNNAIPSHAYWYTDLNIYLHFQVDKLGKDSLINSAKTSMSSKLITTDSDFFAAMVSSYGHLAFSLGDSFVGSFFLVGIALILRV